ncbi:MAG: hypothetical protein ACLVJ6_07000 [Merdibacter sp.]
MLTRAVYYTAITRAKTKLVLVGDQAVLKRQSTTSVAVCAVLLDRITQTQSTQRQMHQETAMVQQTMFS